MDRVGKYLERFQAVKLLDCLPRRLATIIVIGVGINVAGCYTYSTGNLVKKERKVNDNSIVRWNDEIQLISLPKVNNTSLDIRLVRVPYYRVAYTEKYAELKELSDGTALGIMLLGGGVTAAAAGALEDSSGVGPLYGVVGGILATSYGYRQLVENNKSKTGRLIDGRKTTAVEPGKPSPISATTITATMNKVSRSYRTKSSGSVSIDLYSDFNIRRLRNPANYTIKVASRSPSIAKTFNLDSNDWTIPYFEVKADVGWIYQNPSSTARKLGRYSNGEFLVVIDNTTAKSWVKVRRGNITGWIPRLSGTVFWSPRDLS